MVLTAICGSAMSNTGGGRPIGPAGHSGGDIDDDGGGDDGKERITDRGCATPAPEFGILDAGSENFSAAVSGGNINSPFVPRRSLIRSPNKGECAKQEANATESPGVSGAPKQPLDEPSNDATHGGPVRGRAFAEAIKSCTNNAFLKMMVKGSGGTRQRINSLPSDPEEVATGKRKNEMSPEKKAEYKKLKQDSTICQLGEMLKVLSKQVMEQTTVKKETKTQMKVVVDLYEKARREHDDIMMKQKWSGLSKLEKESQMFRQKIDVCSTMEAVNSIIAENWPQGTFKNTKVNPRAKWFTDETVLYSIMLYPDNISEDRNFAQTVEKIPAVKALTEDKLRELGFINVVQEAATTMAGLEECSKWKTDMLIAGATLSDIGDMATADVMNWADRIKIDADRLGKTNVVVGIPSDAHLDKIRKIMECRLSGTELVVQISPCDKRRIIARKPVDSSIVVSGSTSYSEILKTMKDNIVPDDLGVNVKRIQQTQSGALRLTFSEKSSGAREAMLNRIRQIMPEDTRAHANNGRKGIVLMDIEEDISKDEVAETICEKLKVKPEDFNLNDFRKGYRGTKMLTVFLPKAEAIKAIRLRWLRIGWTNCQVREKLDPDFCNRCQKYGHLSRLCQEKEAAKRRCLKCGEQDHIAKECTNEESCFGCGQKGHRANSMRCNVYNALVKGMRGRTSHNDA